MRNKSCCFTGHRPQNFLFGNNENSRECTALKKLLLEETQRKIDENGVDTFYVGMAQGADFWAAEAVIKLKEKYGVKLIAVIPHRGQDNRWGAADRARYADIISKADEKIVLNERYQRWCMQQRNNYMVDNSTHVIGIYSGAAGGTKNTLERAQKKGLNIVIINPDDLSVCRYAATKVFSDEE